MMDREGTGMARGRDVDPQAHRIGMCRFSPFTCGWPGVSVSYCWVRSRPTAGQHSTANTSFSVRVHGALLAWAGSAPS